MTVNERANVLPVLHAGEPEMLPANTVATCEGDRGEEAHLSFREADERQGADAVVN